MDSIDLKIEKLYVPEMDQYRYQLRLFIPGLPSESCVFGVSSFAVERGYDLQRDIYNAIECLVERVGDRLRNYADEIKRQYGDYDTTRLERYNRQEEISRAELRRRMTAAPLPEPRSYTETQNWYPSLAEDLQSLRRNTSLPDKNQRAMDLLKSKIGEEKFEQLNAKGYFEEQGKHGIFRFHLNTQGGVSLIEKKKYGNTAREVEWTLCVQSLAPDLPKGDVILSRWMEWKADEDKFLDTANFRDIKTRDEATQGRAS